MQKQDWVTKVASLKVLASVNIYAARPIKASWHGRENKQISLFRYDL